MKTRSSRFAPIDLNIPIAMLAVALTMIGIIMPMNNRQDDKIEKAIEAMRVEMKDFHDRLIRIEENRRK